MINFAKIKICEDGHTESVVFEGDHIDMVERVRAWKAVFLFVLPFRITGKTYAERQESLRNLAIDFQSANDGDTDFQLSMGEIGVVEEYFERMGRRYGLLREFRENCIC